MRLTPCLCGILYRTQLLGTRPRPGTEIQTEMWRSLNWNSTTFEVRTFSADLKFDECFKRLVVECEFVEKLLLYDRVHMHRERRQTCFFFSNSVCHTNYIYYAQWCVTLYKYEHWFYWLQEIIYCYNHLFYLNQCTTFRLKINASIRIRIQIWKSKFSFDECEFSPASSHH